MYGLTHPGILDALLARGVDVVLKTDKIESAGTTQSAMIAKLKQAGIPAQLPNSISHPSGNEKHNGHQEQ
jgi:hypothetical protein